MKKYAVYQGNMTANGNGDLNEFGRFDTLEEAQELMKKIYNDIEGYSKEPNGYLETNIAINDEDDNFIDNVDGMIFNY